MGKKLTATKVDKKNRILIDRKLREKIGLKAGDSVVLIPVGKEIRIVPVKAKKSFASSLKGFEYAPDDHSATETIQQIVKERKP